MGMSRIWHGILNMGMRINMHKNMPAGKYMRVRMNIVLRYWNEKYGMGIEWDGKTSQ